MPDRESDPRPPEVVFIHPSLSVQRSVDDNTQVRVEPVRPADTDERFVFVTEPLGRHAAAYRLARHRLVTQLGDPQRILVTSPRRRDGTTTLAVNLAAAYSEIPGRRPVVVDAHLGAPGLAAFLRFDPVAFGEWAASPETITVASLPEDRVNALPLLPSSTPRQLVSTGLFSHVLDVLAAESFAPIIVDGPPVLGSVEANLLAGACDGVVLATRIRRTRARDVERAVAQLRPAPVFGTVLLTKHG